jgi:demethylmenaquinone methyltransferase/2-methoxy-6-polyprenyl-1,4-benzoquinol methylase
MAKEELNEEYIIRAPVSPERARKIYDRASVAYDIISYRSDRLKKKGIDIARVKEGNKVLEVGFGTGQILLELAKKVGETGKVYGIEISPKMLEKTMKRVKKCGLSNRVNLKLGDARKLPYDEGTFDMLFNSYMLDLIDTPEIPQIFSEFKRVLKPGGRLVLVNVSKNKKKLTFYERLYKMCGGRCGMFGGGCRPILTKPFLEKLEFQNIGRIYAENITNGAEIVWGDKPEKHEENATILR